MKKVLFALSAGALLAFQSAHAQFYLDASANGIVDSDVDALGQDVQQQDYKFAAGWNFIGFKYKHTVYDFSGNTKWLTHSDQFVIDLHHEGYFSGNDGMGYFGGIGYGIGFEEDVHMNEAYFIPARVGVSIPLDSTLTGYIGAGANWNQADNKYIPIVGVKIGDPRDNGWHGGIAYPYTKIAYRFNPQWQVEARYDAVKEVTQLRDRSPLSQGGYLLEESSSAGLQVTWNPISTLSLYAGGKYFFDRDYDVYDQGGNCIYSTSVDEALGGYVGARFDY